MLLAFFFLLGTVATGWLLWLYDDASSHHAPRPPYPEGWHAGVQGVRAWVCVYRYRSWAWWGRGCGGLRYRRYPSINLKEVSHD